MNMHGLPISLPATMFLMLSAICPHINAQATTTSGSEPKIHLLSANVTLTSDYRYRGLTQTLQRPALQGGFDYSYRGGIYVGTWGSNVSSTLYPKSNMELDLYGGYKFTDGGVGFDVGGLYVFYPSSNTVLANLHTGHSSTSAPITNFELYVSTSWNWLSMKYSHSVTDFYGVPKTRNSGYLDFTATKTYNRGWGLAAHLGRQWIKNFGEASYNDWRLGIFKDTKGFVLGLDFLDTDAKDIAYQYTDDIRSMNIGKAGVVVYLKRVF